MLGGVKAYECHNQIACGQKIRALEGAREPTKPSGRGNGR